ncbi:hypothetical protein PC121_g9824 [Phytophthora cactorum]|nr:hypothetical protein PC121_g9824 [Phytophthora cactorum]KAG4058693.1 hypothetical protein PC123_g6352 [Phytophthora cactorum]
MFYAPTQMGSVSRLSLCVHIVGSRWKLRQSSLRPPRPPSAHSRPHRLHKFSLESRRQIPRALHILAQITNDLRQIDLSCEVGVVQCPAGGGESRFFIPPF